MKVDVEKLISDVGTLIFGKQQKKQQSRQEFIDGVVTGAITDPAAIAKGLETHGVTMREFSAMTRWTVEERELQQKVAAGQVHEATIREVEAERQRVNDTLAAELQAAKMKARAAYVALDERVAVAQQGLVVASNAKVKLLESTPRKDELQRLYNEGAYATQQHTNHPNRNWHGEQQRFQAAVDQTRRELKAIQDERKLVPDSQRLRDQEQKLKTDLARYSSELEQVEAHIHQWESRAKQASAEAQRLEAEILTPKQVSA